MSDHLGSSTKIISAAGVVEEESDFTAFGSELSATSGANHYKFTGKERDETGLDYFGARYYSNGLARFTSVDPRPTLSFQQAGDDKSVAKFQKMLSNPQTWNMYAYCLDNPLRFTDPSGETVIANEKQAENEIRKRKLQEQRAQLTNYAKDLAKQVGAGKLDANKALDMFYNKAAELTKNTSDALLIAVGSSLDIRHATMDLNGSQRNVGNVLTANSLGIDSLHHFAFAAFNTYDNWWAPAAGIANYLVGLEDGPPYSRADGSDADVVADVAGAYFGQDLSKNAPNPLQPSAKIPFGKQWLNELEHPVEKQGGVVK